jgi:hypothetical protein
MRGPQDDKFYLWIARDGRLVCGDYSCHGGLEFDLDLLEVGGADVFGGVGDGVAPACGPGFGTAFDHFAVLQGDFQFSIGQKVRDIFGMRMHGRDLAGLEVYGEDADVLVFEDDCVAVAGDFGDVLRGSGAGGGVNGGGGEQSCGDDCSRNFHGSPVGLERLLRESPVCRSFGDDTPGDFVGAKGRQGGQGRKRGSIFG